jgi:hypothetical protein
MSENEMMKVAAPDQRHVGLYTAEGVGCVHKAGGQNARQAHLPSCSDANSA